MTLAEEVKQLAEDRIYQTLGWPKCQCDSEIYECELSEAQHEAILDAIELATEVCRKAVEAAAEKAHERIECRDELCEQCMTAEAIEKAIRSLLPQPTAREPK